MIYLYLFGTCFHFIYVFMIIGNIINPKNKSFNIMLNIVNRQEALFYLLAEF